MREIVNGRWVTRDLPPIINGQQVIEFPPAEAQSHLPEPPAREPGIALPLESSSSDTTAALTQFRVPLSLPPKAPTQGPGNTITLDTSMFLKTEGLVSGPIYVRTRHTSLASPDDLYFLPEREIINIPAGSAIQVMSYLQFGEARWHVVDFPHGGRLRGPLAWSWSRPLGSDEVLLRYGMRQSDLAMGLTAIGSAVLALVGGFALGSSLPIGDLAYVAGVLTGAALAYPGGKIGWSLAKRRLLEKHREIPHSDVSIELPRDFKKRIDKLRGNTHHPDDGDIHASEEVDHDKASWPTFSTIMDFAKSQTQVDAEIRRALGAFLDSCDKTTSQDSLTPSGSLAKAKLSHTSKKIWEISQEIAAHPSIKQNEYVREELLLLLEKADDSVKAFERDCDDQKCRSVLADIRALHRQLDGYAQNTSSDEGSTSHGWEPA